MTKKVIIDNVNVSKCKYFSENKVACGPSEFLLFCNKFPNCKFKQTQRKIKKAKIIAKWIVISITLVFVMAWLSDFCNDVIRMLLSVFGGSVIGSFALIMCISEIEKSEG